jgi:hypothetical protein
LEEFMDVSRERISYTLIPKLVNSIRNHENLSLFLFDGDSNVATSRGSRFSGSELNLIDKTRTDGAVTLITSKKSLDKETPVRTKVTVCTSQLEIPQNHSFSFYQLLLHELFALSIHQVVINI